MSLSLHSQDSFLVDEQSPLLGRPSEPQSENSNVALKSTPLPKLQITIAVLQELCEPITSLSIYPYINQLVSELDITGGDKKKVGYYAGLIESLFFATEAMTILQWSHASDRIGRKPVLLIGMAGAALSMLCFGLSRTFWALVLSRCLCGLLNGNIGVMKSILGELTDTTNRAEAFALLGVGWSTGTTLGPLIGGSLYRPHDRFPSIFTGNFWKNFPYFLPCAVAACVVFLLFLLTAFLFEETLPSKKKYLKASVSGTSELALGSNATPEPNIPKNPISLHKLMVYPVILSVSCHASLAFLHIALAALLPLFMAMPIDIGGLGFQPPTIGYTMGVYGIGAGIFETMFFAKIVRRFGERRLFVIGMASFIPLFLFFPIMSQFAQRYGITLIVWVFIAVVLSLTTIVDMGYGCIFMYITTSAPDKHSLGATNGLSQMTVSIARAIGPATATSLFSFSAENNLMGGYGVYAILTFLSILALRLAICLPPNVWEQHDEESASN